LLETTSHVGGLQAGIAQFQRLEALQIRMHAAAHLEVQQCTISM
jgi:hypothetical protein